MRKCANCGAEVDDAAKFCGNCGTSLSEVAPVEEKAKEVKEAVEDKASDSVEIPVLKAPETSGIQLTLEGYADDLLAKAEVDAELAEAQAKREAREAAIRQSLEEKENDLSDVLTKTSTDTQTIGRAQAQRETVNPIDLVVPEETEKQVEAKKEAVKEVNSFLGSAQKTIQEKLKEAPKVDTSRFEKAAEEVGKQAGNMGQKAVETAGSIKEIIDNADVEKAKDGRDRIMAIASYINFLGFAVAWFLTKDERRSEFLKGHMNTALLLNILFWLVRGTGLGILNIIFLFVWVFFVFHALSGKYKKLPVLKDIKIIK